MKLSKTLFLSIIVALLYSISPVYASGDHEHEHEHGDEHGHDHEGEGLVIEDGQCVGLLGRPGQPGKFLQGSEEMALSIEVAECNLCIADGHDEQECLHDEDREQIIASIVEDTHARPGRRVGSKVEFHLNDSSEVEYICHFHTYESGEIDCH